MVFEIILSGVIPHNFKINVRDKIKLKNFNPTHLSKNYEKIDVLIFETIENNCELYFLQDWMKTLIRAIKFLSYQKQHWEFFFLKFGV